VSQAQQSTSSSTDRAGARPGPLAGVRVLDIATFIAAPFCGTILADFGAEVIKIEQPGEGDSLRQFGTVTECGDSLIWLSEARNKQTATLDLRQPAGAELFRQLVAESDVVLENFRPGTLEKWGIGYEDLRRINPRLVMLRISAYGQTGPKSQEPGFARIAHAFSGLANLAGEAGGPPVVPGSTSMADYTSGMWGAIGVLLALRVVESGGAGQFIDIGLYESVFRLLDEMAPAYARYGVVRERLGADVVNVVPHSHYRCAGGEWVALACSNHRMFERLAGAMGQPDLALAYPNGTVRVANREAINQRVADWIAGLSLADVLRQTQEAGVPCAQIYTIEDIFKDPQYAARANMLTVQDARAGELVLPAAVPRLSATPASFRHSGRGLAADNEAVYQGLLGLTAERMQALRQARVI